MENVHDEPGWYRLVEAEVDPHATHRDATSTPIPRAVFAEASARGLFGASFPAELGGSGMSSSRWGDVLRTLGRRGGDLSFPLVLSLFVGVAQSLLGRRDTMESPLTRELVLGQRLVAFAYSEDADAFSLRTTARKFGDEIVLDGAKSIVTGGCIADSFLIYAREPSSQDMVAVLVDRDAPGLGVTPVRTMGVRAAGLASLQLDGVRVPVHRVLVPQDGLAHVQAFLDRRRVLLCCAPLGRAHEMLDECARQSIATIRHGRRLADLPNVQASLGRMRIGLHAADCVLRDALAQLHETTQTWTPRSAMAKHFVAERCLEVARGVQRLAGGRGYTDEARFERDVRDISGLVAGAGAQDILETNLGLGFVSELERREFVTP